VVEEGGRGKGRGDGFAGRRLIFPRGNDRPALDLYTDGKTMIFCLSVNITLNDPISNRCFR
jgi:hypothetical protein